MAKRYLTILFLLPFFILLILPILQMKFKFISDQQLSSVRARDLEEFPAPAIDNFMSGNFQAKFDKWFGQNFGFREYLIKFHNQIIYSIFRESPVEGVVVGKNEQLFGTDDLSAYMQLPEPFKQEPIETIAAMLAETQSLLSKRGIVFIVLITPNKAILYPEFIPVSYSNVIKYNHYKENENYNTYISSFSRCGVNYIDGIQILKSLKQDINYPLFPRGGYHWNNFGAVIVIRDLIHKIEQLTNKSMVHLVLNGVNVDHYGHGPDVDIAQVLNLFYPPFDFACPRPLLTANEPMLCWKPRILFAGGSYLWSILSLLDRYKITSDMSAIFYYQSMIDYSDITPENRPIKSIQWDAKIFNNDVIVLEMNPHCFSDRVADIGQGFIQDVILKLKNKHNKTRF
jgi:alginate O-acetyltransferase complex protein AlgJ